MCDLIGGCAFAEAMLGLVWALIGWRSEPRDQGLHQEMQGLDL